MDWDNLLVRYLPKKNLIPELPPSYLSSRLMSLSVPAELARTGRTKSSELVGRHCPGAPAVSQQPTGTGTLIENFTTAGLVGGLFNL